MKNECWCVDLSLNDELQDAVEFFNTEEDAIKYCLKEASVELDCFGHRCSPSVLHRKDKRTVEVYVDNNKYVWRYYPYNAIEEFKKLFPKFTVEEIKKITRTILMAKMLFLWIII